MEIVLPYKGKMFKFLTILAVAILVFLVFFCLFSVFYKDKIHPCHHLKHLYL